MSTSFHFADAAVREMSRKKSILVVGLDPQLRYMPPHLAKHALREYGRSWQAIGELFLRFNCAVIDAVAPFAVAIKPQFAFYAAYGRYGLSALERTIEYARGKGVLEITDAKPGDGSDTADAYADTHIGEVPFWGEGDTPLQLSRRPSPIRADCVTVNPYIGDDCVLRFAKPVHEFGTGIFVVDKTSFRPNSRVEELVTDGGLKVWQSVAHMVREWGEGTTGASGFTNVGVVLGATKPEDAAWMRETLPRALMLVPGYGAQGGGADAAVITCTQEGLGCLVSTSREVTYPYWDFKKNELALNIEGLPYDPEDFESHVRISAMAAQQDLNDALRRAGKYHF